MKKVALFLAVSLLFVTGYFGLSNGVQEVGDAQTGLQRSVSIAGILHGLLGFIAGFAIMRRDKWRVPAAVAWSVAITYTGTVASFAYSDPTFSQSGTLVGAIGACIVIALIGAFVVWTARRRENASV
jgi:ABC-type Na+ efflux pump permease subunit